MIKDFPIIAYSSLSIENGTCRDWSAFLFDRSCSRKALEVICRVMRLSTSGFYAWKAKGAQLIDHQTWLLCSRMKTLFAESLQSLGSRRMVQQLRKEGFNVGRYRVRRLIRKLDLVVQKKKRFVTTTDSKHLQPVAANLLAREFNPPEANRVWSTDITYIWMYLAVVKDLYSRRLVGWHMDQ